MIEIDKDINLLALECNAKAVFLETLKYDKVKGLLFFAQKSLVVACLGGLCFNAVYTRLVASGSDIDLRVVLVGFLVYLAIGVYVNLFTLISSIVSAKKRLKKILYGTPVEVFNTLVNGNNLTVSERWLYQQYSNILVIADIQQAEDVKITKVKYDEARSICDVYLVISNKKCRLENITFKVTKEGVSKLYSDWYGLHLDIKKEG